ncbi:MAG: hypothetical protein R2702_08500 [Acidimicrobiales bacterium]
MIPQPAPAGPVLDGPRAKLPGLVGIWIGIVLIVVGIGLGAVLVVGGAKRIVGGVSDLHRVPIETGGTVQIDEAGEVSVYAERLTLDRSSGFTTGGTAGLPPVALSVYGPDGDPVPVVVPTVVERYTWDQHEGVRIATFGAEEPGAYEIVPTSIGAIGGYRTLAVGPTLALGRGIAGILGGIFGGGLVIVVGVVVLIVSSVRRSRPDGPPRGPRASVGRPGPRAGRPLRSQRRPPTAVVLRAGRPRLRWRRWAAPGHGPSGLVPPAAPPWSPPGPASAPPEGPPGWVPPPAPPPPGYGDRRGPTS